MTSDDTHTSEHLLDALRAVLEAVDIPNGATMGAQETRDAILLQRVGHVAVMLRSLLSRNSWDNDWSWSVQYLRERLAEHPATGYKTWGERVIELEAARAASPKGGAQ